MEKPFEPPKDIDNILKDLWNEDNKIDLIKFVKVISLIDKRPEKEVMKDCLDYMGIKYEEK